MTITAPHWTPAAIPDQTGRTALITGANSGIGLQTARVLAAHGARVVLAGRDRSRLDAAAAEIHAETPSADLDTLILDLGSLDSIRLPQPSSPAPRAPIRSTTPTRSGPPRPKPTSDGHSIC